MSSTLPSLSELFESGLQSLFISNLLDDGVDHVFFKDRSGRFLNVSHGWLSTIGQGCALAEVLGKTDYDFFTDSYADAARADELLVMSSGKPIAAKLERESYPNRPSVLVSTTRLPLRTGAGEIIGTYGISRRISKTVAHEAAAHHARRDSVTDLLNRAAFEESVSAALADAEGGERIAVLVADIDAFREINLNLGREAGDMLLVQVAERLHAAARHSDDLARLGADRFAVLCRGLSDEDRLVDLAARVLQSLRPPYLHGSADSVSVSVGIACSAPGIGRSAALIANAEAATRVAKRRGGNRAETFQPTLSAQGEVSDVTAQPQDAIECAQLFLVYQPIVSMTTGQISSVEALVRWRHPERGILTPDTFIAQAERDGAITRIDECVLRTACRRMAAWQQVDPSWRSRSVSVNLSAASIQDPDLPQRVAAAIRENMLRPDQLCLEITETAAIDDLDDARRTMADLSRLGVSLALDDFGTGYSTLSHVQQLTADVLKIDRSFVARLGGNRRDRDIVAAVCAMGHALGMTLVAEGVETDEQLRELAQYACDFAQGYLISRPLDEAQLLETIRAKHLECDPAPPDSPAANGSSCDTRAVADEQTCLGLAGSPGSL